MYFIIMHRYLLSWLIKKVMKMLNADCSCALENMMLEANELELGRWINQLRWLDENPRINE